VTMMETPSRGGSSSRLARWLAAMRWKKNSPTMASQPRPHSIHPSSSLFPLPSPPEEGPALPLEEEADAPSPFGAGGRRRRSSPAMRKEEGKESLMSASKGKQKFEMAIYAANSPAVFLFLLSSCSMED
jgi:hypothetical protein